MQHNQYGEDNIKKIIYTILLFIILPPTLLASSNTLTINSEFNKLYYDTDNISSDSFLYHIDMTPGKRYEDYLEIKNLTNDSYMMYIKIKSDSINENELQLLDNINIIIHNKDDKLIYDGPAIGTNYRVDNTLLESIINIGYYNPYDTDNLTINTTLKKDYENIDDSEPVNIEWEFYCLNDSKTQIINPNTNDTVIKNIIVLITTLILIIITIIYKKRRA